MERFLIEREIEGASELTTEQLAEIAKTSNAAVESANLRDHPVRLAAVGVRDRQRRPRPRS